MNPRLFLHVMSVEARTRMSYRVDFWISATVGFLAEFGLLVFIWQAMFRESGVARIQGFDLNGILLYYGCVVLLAKVVRGQEFSGSVSQDIYEGGLNRYLVFPTSYFAFKYAQHLGGLVPYFVQAVFFGVWFPILLDVPPEMRITPWTLGMGLLAILGANLLYFLMGLPLQAVAFWADNVWSLSVALRFVSSLLGGVMLPLALFPDWSQPVLSALPFRYLFDFPVTALLGRLSPGEWALGMASTLAWCAVLGLVCRFVWRRGDLQYSGVGI